MKRTVISLAAVTFAASSLVGCAGMTETQRDASTGAAIGAVAGAVVGRATAGDNKARGTATGAAVGAALGGAGGYFWSKHMQEQKAAMEKATAGTGVEVSQTADNQLKLEIPSDVSIDLGR